MRKGWLALIGVLVLILVGILIFKQHIPTQKLYNVGALGSNIQYPWLKDQKTVYYFTGEGFAQYYLDSGKTAMMSKQFSLPTITSVEWSPTGALFQASGYSGVDDLYGRLQADHRDTDNTYWWEYNISTGTIEPAYAVLGGINPTNITWGEKGQSLLYTAVESAPGTPQTTSMTGVNDQEYDPNQTGLFRFGGGKTSELVPPKEQVGDIIGEANGVVYYNDSDTRQLNRVVEATKKISKVDDNYSQQGILSADGRYVAYTSNNSKQPKKNSGGDDAVSSLRIVDTQSNKRVYEQKKFIGLYTFQSDSSLLINYVQKGATKYLMVNPSTNKKVAYLLPQKGTGDANTLVSINPADASFGTSDINNNFLTYSATAKPIIDTPNNQYKIQDYIFEDGFTMNYATDSGQYSIYITKNPYTQYQNKALDYIKKQGIDPNQIYIKWYSNDGVNRN